MSNEIFKSYERLGFKLCALHHRRKEPIYPGYRENGLPIDYWSQPAASHHGAGLLHGLSNTCVIDIDNVDLFSEWLEANNTIFGDIDIRDLTDFGRVYYSGSPNRMKIVYRLKKPLLTLSVQYQGEHIGELRCVDKKGLSMYDVLPPSIHPEGTVYEWEYGQTPTVLEDLPEWFRKVWEDEATEQVKERGKQHVSYGVIKWFDELIWKNQSTLDYATKIGYISIEDGYKNGKWMYSGSSSAGKGEGHGISEMPFGDKLYSYHQSCPLHDKPISPSDLFSWKHNCVGDYKKLIDKLEKLPEWKKELDAVGKAFNAQGGPADILIKSREITRGERLPTDFLEWMASEVYRRQHMRSMGMARVVVLILCTTATAGKYRHRDQNTPTSVYWTICGKTGSGKAIIQKVVNGVMGSTCIKDFPMSASGYFKDLQTNKSIVHYVDEYGRKLTDADKNFEGVITKMMQTYSEHDVAVTQGSYSMATVRSDTQTKQLEKEVVHPTPGLVQVTTWETLRPNITPTRISSGELGRSIPWFIESKPVRHHGEVTSGPWREDVIMWFRQFRRIQKTLRIEEHTEARRMRIAYVDEMDKTDSPTLEALRNRRNENILRLSGALSAITDPVAPTITVDIMRFTLAIVKKGGKAYENEIMQNIVKTNIFAAALKNVVMFIELNGGSVTKTQLYRNCPAYRTFSVGTYVGSEARDRLLAEGVEAEVFEIVTTKAEAGRPRQTVTLHHRGDSA